MYMISLSKSQIERLIDIVNRLIALEKSNYGPQGWGLYSPNDNAQRKMGRTGEEVAIGANKAVHAAKPAMSVRLNQEAAELKRKNKKQPVRRFSQSEINDYLRKLKPQN